MTQVMTQIAEARFIVIYPGHLTRTTVLANVDEQVERDVFEIPERYEFQQADPQQQSDLPGRIDITPGELVGRAGERLGL